MKWEEFDRMMPIDSWSKYKETDVECPKCGKKVKMRRDIVLTSYPAQYQYECECGWVGYSHAKA